jgi:molybdopterin converting factor subunit 1
VHVTIRLFARLREVAGASELTRSIAEGSTAGDAWQALVAEFPPLADHSSSISVAVNEEYAKPATALRDGDEVAFLPPVSGGDGANERSRVSDARGARRRNGARENV